MTTIYPVIFTEVDTNILIEVPDLGIITESNEEGQSKGTLSDAIRMARDAIGIKCIGLEDSGKEVPKASRIPEINVHDGAFADAGESVVSLVDVNLTEYRRKLDKHL